MKIAGTYLDGSSSKQHQAELIIDESSELLSLSLTFWHIDGVAETINLNIEDLEVASRLGSTPREVAFSDKLFATDDNASIDRLVNLIGVRSHSLLHRLESNLSLIIVSTLVVVAFISLFSIYGVPKIAKAIAFNLPDVSLQDNNTLSILDETVFEPSEISVEKQQDIVLFLAPYLEEYKELQPRLNFRSGMAANALALPNGDIVFTDDFVNLANTNNELLAVFFHELGHLKHKHILRRIIQDSMITLMVIFITGDLDVADLVTGIPTLVLDLSYSRDFEREADNYALEQLSMHNIALDNFSTIMLSIDGFYKSKNTNEDNTAKDESNNINFLSTHPSTDDRVDFVKKFKLNNSIQ